MVATQITTLLGILRRDGARVVFATPPPDGTEHAPTDNPIWAATLPVLRAQHVDVIDIAPAVAGPDGGRVDTALDCRGNAIVIRKAKEVHYTRYGVGLAGTVLARGIAALLHRTLPHDAAPGDHAVALVPTRSGKGYWIVQCDGSVYRFGDAAAVDGVVGSPDVPFVGAVAAPARGLWLVAHNGNVVATGGAPALTFAARARARLSRRPSRPTAGALRRSRRPVSYERAARSRAHPRRSCASPRSPRARADTGS